MREQLINQSFFQYCGMIVYKTFLIRYLCYLLPSYSLNIRKARVVSDRSSVIPDVHYGYETNSLCRFLLLMPMKFNYQLREHSYHPSEQFTLLFLSAPLPLLPDVTFLLHKLIGQVSSFNYDLSFCDYESCRSLFQFHFYVPCYWTFGKVERYAILTF